MADKPPVLRDTDDEARRLARTLLRGARSATLGVIEPDSGGFPFTSRVLLGHDIDGAAVILVSGLSTHTQALDADPRCSLLAGEPGKGDPLAHPRLTVQCLAERVEAGGEDHARIRARFLRRHPKSGLYIDFPDFAFFRLVPQRASLNGGFGRAYRLAGSELTINSPAAREIAEMEAQVLETMAENQPEAAGRCAVDHLGAEPADWRICGIDAAGLDLAAGDDLKRFEFTCELRDPAELCPILSKLWD